MTWAGWARDAFARLAHLAGVTAMPLTISRPQTASTRTPNAVGVPMQAAQPDPLPPLLQRLGRDLPAPTLLASSDLQAGQITEGMATHMGIANVGAGIVHGVEGVGHAIAHAVTVGEKVVKIIEDGSKFTPQLKIALAGLINDAKGIALAATPAIAGGGTNVAADLVALPAVIAAVVKLVEDITAAEPLIEQAIAVVKTDINYH